MESNQLLNDLSARLPELEWKINELGAAFSAYRLPRGLFRTRNETNGSMYIAEINADIYALSQQTNERGANYLAQRILQKVNVLVSLCQIFSNKIQTGEKNYFGVKMLSTRQQWIHDLEVEIQTMEAQRQAMNRTLEQMLCRTHHPDAVLQLKADIGKIEQRLTLAQETLDRAIS
ncbi:MAG: hypothetical protein QM652_03930 [Legionella sp.]|uniref:hypothetical protein n=1 Tax=Legionella sp. TaxID=459 RepID=UPI0039E6E905